MQTKIQYVTLHSGDSWEGLIKRIVFLSDIVSCDLLDFNSPTEHLQISFATDLIQM